MAVSKAMRRLLRIRNLEEEQSRAVLESAMGELDRLEAARGAADERERRGWGLVKTSARSGELPDRLSGMNEVSVAEECAAVLGKWLEEKKAEAAALREAFLAKRVERLQAETLIEETQARDMVESNRRGQQAADDWYLTRARGNGEG